jgi:subtilase family serine protease
VPALVGGAASTVTTTMVLPSNIAAKAYSLIAQADSDSGVVETNETNNAYARTVTIGSDLVIGVPGITLKAAAGMSVDVGDTVTNQGGGLSTPSITRYYLSTNTTLSADDILLGGGREVDALSPGGTSAGTTAVWLPTSASPGVFYLVGKADGDNAVAETSESNNTESRAVAIGPDLIVSAASVPASGVAGSAIAIADTVTNQGGDGAAPTTTRFYLSTNSSLDAGDIALTTGRAVPPVAAGASSGGTTLVTIPPSTAPGFYYLILKADGDNAAGESYESNNVLLRSLSVTAAP